MTWGPSGNYGGGSSGSASGSSSSGGSSDNSKRSTGNWGPSGNYGGAPAGGGGGFGGDEAPRGGAGDYWTPSPPGRGAGGWRAQVGGGGPSGTGWTPSAPVSSGGDWRNIVGGGPMAVQRWANYNMPRADQTPMPATTGRVGAVPMVGPSVIAPWLSKQLPSTWSWAEQAAKDVGQWGGQAVEDVGQYPSDLGIGKLPLWQAGLNILGEFDKPAQWLEREAAAESVRGGGRFLQAKPALNAEEEKRQMDAARAVGLRFGSEQLGLPADILASAWRNAPTALQVARGEREPNISFTPEDWQRIEQKARDYQPFTEAKRRVLAGEPVDQVLADIPEDPTAEFIWRSVFDPLNLLQAAVAPLFKGLQLHLQGVRQVTTAPEVLKEIADLGLESTKHVDEIGTIIRQGIEAGDDVPFGKIIVDNYSTINARAGQALAASERKATARYSPLKFWQQTPQTKRALLSEQVSQTVADMVGRVDDMIEATAKAPAMLEPGGNPIADAIARSAQAGASPDEIRNAAMPLMFMAAKDNPLHLAPFVGREVATSRDTLRLSYLMKQSDEVTKLDDIIKTAQQAVEKGASKEWRGEALQQMAADWNKVALDMHPDPVMPKALTIPSKIIMGTNHALAMLYMGANPSYPIRNFLTDNSIRLMDFGPDAFSTPFHAKETLRRFGPVIAAERGFSPMGVTRPGAKGFGFTHVAGVLEKLDAQWVVAQSIKNNMPKFVRQIVDKVPPELWSMVTPEQAVVLRRELGAVYSTNEVADVLLRVLGNGGVDPIPNGIFSPLAGLDPEGAQRAQSILTRSADDVTALKQLDELEVSMRQHAQGVADTAAKTDAVATQSQDVADSVRKAMDDGLLNESDANAILRLDGDFNENLNKLRVREDKAKARAGKAGESQIRAYPKKNPGATVDNATEFAGDIAYDSRIVGDEALLRQRDTRTQVDAFRAETHRLINARKTSYEQGWAAYYERADKIWMDEYWDPVHDAYRQLEKRIRDGTPRKPPPAAAPVQPALQPPSGAPGASATDIRREMVAAGERKNWGVVSDDMSEAEIAAVQKRQDYSILAKGASDADIVRYRELDLAPPTDAIRVEMNAIVDRAGASGAQTPATGLPAGKATAAAPTTPGRVKPIPEASVRKLEAQVYAPPKGGTVRYANLGKKGKAKPSRIQNTWRKYMGENYAKDIGEAPQTAMDWAKHSAERQNYWNDLLEAQVKNGGKTPSGYPTFEELPADFWEHAAREQLPADIIDGLAERTSQSVKIDDIVLAPDIFQYKVESVREAGETGVLKGITKWDENLGSGVALWVDPNNGNTYLVDGHQRMGAAKRLGATELKAPHYIKAKTAAEARYIGAIMNITTGRGTRLDAATMFRELALTPDELVRRGISLKEGMANDGIVLANLHDTLFTWFKNKQLPVERAKIFGGITDKGLQWRLMEEVQKLSNKGHKVTNDIIQELADVIESGPRQTATQQTLFGEQAITQSNALERAEFLAHVASNLKKENRLSGFLTRNAGDIEQRGLAVVDRAAAENVSEQAAILLELFDRVKNFTGKVSQLADEAAEALVGSKTPGKVMSEYYERVIETLPDEFSGAGAVGGRGGAGIGAEGAAQAGLFDEAAAPGTTIAEARGAYLQREPSYVEPPIADKDAVYTLSSGEKLTKEQMFDIPELYERVTGETHPLLEAQRAKQAAGMPKYDAGQWVDVLYSDGRRAGADVIRVPLADERPYYTLRTADGKEIWVPEHAISNATRPRVSIAPEPLLPSTTTYPMGGISGGGHTIEGGQLKGMFKPGPSEGFVDEARRGGPLSNFIVAEEAAQYGDNPFASIAANAGRKADELGGIMDALRGYVRGRVKTPTPNQTAYQAWAKYLGTNFGPELSQAKSYVTKIAAAERNFVLHNYGDRRNIDVALAHLMPWSFWYTRTAPKMAYRLASRPALLARYVRLLDTLEEVNKDLPEFYQHNFVMQLPLMDYPVMLNLRSTVDPIYGFLDHFKDPDRERTGYGKLMAEMGKYGPAPFGPLLWNYALERWLADKPEEAEAVMGGYFAPITRASKYASALLGARGGQGVTLEPWLFPGLGNWLKGRGEFKDVEWFGGESKWDTRAVPLTLVQMANKGITVEQLAEAAHEQRGPIWARAVAGTVQKRAPWALLGFAFGAGFKGRTPEDVEIEQAYDRWFKMWDKFPGRDAPQEKLDVFYDELAEFERDNPYFSYLQMGKRGYEYERDAKYIDLIFDRMPPGAKNQEPILRGIGGLAPEIWLKYRDDKYATGLIKRERGEIPPNMFDGWTEPEFEALMYATKRVAALMPEPTQPYKDEWQRAMDANNAMYKEMEKRFPGVQVLQEQYSALDKNSQAAKDLLKQHPELPDSWDFQAEYRTEYNLYPYYGTPPHPKYEEMRQRYGPDIQDKLDRYFEIRDDQGKTAAKNYISAHPEVAQAFDYLRSQENVPNPNALNLTYDYAWAKPAAAGEVQATAGPFVDIVHRTATKYQVSPADVFAIIHVESRGIADAVNGDSKASGLMQVMPSDALISPESFVNRPTSKDLLDPTVNIEWGTRILKQYLDSSGGDLKQALYKYSGYSGTGDMARFEKEYWEPFLAARADAESVQPSAPSPPGVSVPSVAQAAVPPIEPAPSGAWGTQYQPSSYAARRTYGGGGGGGRRGGWVDYPPRQTASTTEGTMFPWWWWYYHKRPHLGPMHWRW